MLKKISSKLIAFIIFILTASLLIISATSLAAKNTTAKLTPHAQHKQRAVILFIWDGMRPDSISKADTPNLFKLRQAGTEFSDNHSSYPTFTMMNASTFATGDFAGKTGFFGNTLWDPKATGPDAENKNYDFQQPVFTEDYHLLQDLNRQAALVQVLTLFEQAHKKNIQTAAVGKSGPAFFQDYLQGGVVLDEKHVWPYAFAQHLIKNNVAIPAATIYTYKNIKLNKNNGNPTAYEKVAVLNDGVTTNPNTSLPSPYNKDTAYLMHMYLDEVIPYAHPKLSVVWLRNPDTTEHNYGVGSKPYYSALHNQDKLLGNLIKKLQQQKKWKNTDLIIVSDHAHSNVSGPLNFFPKRGIKNNKVSTIQENGYSVSGDIRPADLLSKAGFKHVYDGGGCEYDPVMSGILANGKHIYPTQHDTTGKVCQGEVKVSDLNGHRHQTVGTRYTTPAYLVPKKLTADDSIIVAPNGGSTYLYLPSHNTKLVKKVVKFLQSREEFGAVFIDPRYQNVPGTLPLSLVKLENKSHRNPDIIVGSNFDANAIVMGYRGTEYNSSGSDRGMHGSFSPIDVHNMLIAFGPDFKHKFRDTLPTGNVDVAPTIAKIMGLSMPNTDGRILLEAFSKKPKTNSVAEKLPQVSSKIISSTAAKKLIIAKPTDPYGRDLDAKKHNYKIELHIKSLKQNGNTYTYFDKAVTKRY